MISWPSGSYDRPIVSGEELKIAGCRFAEYRDLQFLRPLMQNASCDLFRDVDLEKLYERSCLSLVQYNESGDVITGVFASNCPNVPAVLGSDWPNWQLRLYGREDVTSGNTMFLHYLVWMKRYEDIFYETLLRSIFDFAADCANVILIMPPHVAANDVIERHMTKVKPKDAEHVPNTQNLLIKNRYSLNPKLKIRRAVEEDNDDIVSIIDREAPFLKKLHGEFFINEILNNPEDGRWLIVSDTGEEVPNGVMCLNSEIDIDALNVNFELGPFNDLRRFPEPNPKFSEQSFSFSSLTRTFTSSSEETVYGSAEATKKMDDSGMEMKSDEIVTEDDKTMTDEEYDVVSGAASEARCSRDSAQIAISALTSRTERQSAATTSRQVAEKGIETSPGAIETNEREMTHSPGAEDSIESISDVNVFIVEFFAMNSEIDENRARDFLEAAFECFPDTDYCALLKPTADSYYKFLNLFVRVPLKHHRDYPMCLYLVHRATIYGDVAVRDYRAEDYERVENFIDGIRDSRAVLADLEKPEIRCFLVTYTESVVGLATLRDESDPDVLRYRYRVDDHVITRNVGREEHGRILQFVLAPIFAVRHAHLFRELTRLADLTVLYYRLRASDTSSMTRTSPIASCLGSMVPVRPRRGMEDKKLDYKEEEIFSLFVTSPKWSLTPFLIVDYKIVVVGASDCGLAFLEHLSLGPTSRSLRYASLTLVSHNGTPFEESPVDTPTNGTPYKGRYSRDYWHKIAGRAWIDVVNGSVVSINRREKYVTVRERGNLVYDYLILTCGNQYRTPLSSRELELLQKRRISDVRAVWNFLTVNSDHDASRCLKKIQISSENFTRKKEIVFYGRGIDCYCALNAVLKCGIDGSWIKLIEPRPSEENNYDDVYDGAVKKFIDNFLAQIGVKHFPGWTLVDSIRKKSYNAESKNRELIERLIIQSEDSIEYVPCDFLFYFAEKMINVDILLAISEAGLVYDGQLVIDSKCTTNDPSIYAAGTMTKYSRKYRADCWRHKYCNSVEVGERLGEIFGAEIMKIQADRVANSYPSSSMFQSARVSSCILPGGYHYLNVRKPGSEVAPKIAIDDDSGDVLITGNCASEIGYFRIQLDTYDTVEMITCFSREEIRVNDLISLCGKPEKLLNDLKIRYRNSLIDNFFAYFREPWAAAIFHDDFDSLRAKNITALPLQITSERSLFTEARKILEKLKGPILEEYWKKFEKRYLESRYHRQIEKNVIEFLEEHEQELPMYCTQRVVRQFSRELEENFQYESKSWSWPIDCFCSR